MTNTPAEFERDTIGRGSVGEVLDSTVGKQISNVWFGPDPSDGVDHESERLRLDFTDGSSLELQIGSNLGELRDRMGSVKPRHVSCTFIACVLPAWRVEQLRLINDNTGACGAARGTSAESAR